MKRYKGTGVYFAKVKKSDAVDNIFNALLLDIAIISGGYAAFLRGGKKPRIAISVASTKARLREIVGPADRRLFRGICRKAKGGAA